MRFLQILFAATFLTLYLHAQEDAIRSTTTENIDDGYMGIEAGIGYNAYPTSEYLRAPLYFTAGSTGRDISTRVLILSDIAHASDYFAGNNAFLNPNGLYTYNFGILDIDYLSWNGKLWSAGFGGGFGHQGFLIQGAEKAGHAIIGRLRAQVFLFWFDYFATQFVATLPFAFYQSATDEFRLWHTEANFLFDFRGRVRSPEPQSLLFSISLHHDYVHLRHSLRTYSQHEFTPLIKVTVLY